MKGLVLITGTTSGVGLNTLKPLIRIGWEVIAVNRSNKRAVATAQQCLTDYEMKNMPPCLSNVRTCKLACIVNLSEGKIQRNFIH